MGCAVWAEDFFAQVDFCKAMLTFGHAFASITITG